MRIKKPKWNPVLLEKPINRLASWGLVYESSTVNITWLDEGKEWATREIFNAFQIFSRRNSKPSAMKIRALKRKSKHMTGIGGSDPYQMIKDVIEIVIRKKTDNVGYVIQLLHDNYAYLRKKGKTTAEVSIFMQNTIQMLEAAGLASRYPDELIKLRQVVCMQSKQAE